jgi:hypothetical protein
MFNLLLLLLKHYKYITIKEIHRSPYFYIIPFDLIININQMILKSYNEWWVMEMLLFSRTWCVFKSK